MAIATAARRTPDPALLRRLIRRFVPFLGLCYLVNGIDRLNVSVAALTMNAALGLSAAQFGLGVAAFFWTYTLLQLPSNLLLARVGARRWLAAIMILWGVCSSAMALVSDATSLILARMLLGAAEAGFFPGVVFFAAQWFPPLWRGRFIGYVSACGVASTVIGPPLATTLLRLDGTLGLQGWQWLFAIEGLPAIILGLVCLRVLADAPSRAAWLEPHARAGLQSALEGAQQRAREAQSLRSVLLEPQLLLLVALWFGIELGAYGLAYWMPLVIKEMGFTNTQVGYVATLPGLAGCIAMLWWARHSDRTGERRRHLAIPMLVGGGGLICTGLLLAHPVLALGAMSVAAAGIVSSGPILWTFPGSLFSGTAAAAGIAIINSIGNVAGFVSPPIIGMITDASGSFHYAMIASGIPMLIVSVMVPFLARTARTARLTD